MLLDNCNNRVLLCKILGLHPFDWGGNDGRINTKLIVSESSFRLLTNMQFEREGRETEEGEVLRICLFCVIK